MKKEVITDIKIIKTNTKNLEIQIEINIQKRNTKTCNITLNTRSLGVG